MDFLIQYPWVIPVTVALLIFVINQMQRRKDKTEPQPERDYVLPEYKADNLEDILDHIKSTFPSKISGLMLCEFSGGKFDVAIGLETMPIFVGSDYGKIVKVIDLDHNKERKFIKIVNESGYFGLVVFDENQQPLIGRYKIASTSKLKGKGIGAFQIQQNGVFGKVLIDIDDYQFRGMPTFGIKEKISIGPSTTPVFLNENEFLGFASYLVPAKYKSSFENEKKVRKLIQPAYNFGVIAETLLTDKELNFTFDKVEERAINAKNK